MKQNNRVQWLLAAIWLIVILPFSIPCQKREDVKLFSCKNGIPVIAERLRNLPLVHIVLALHSGSKHENDNQVGLSHLLEHLILFSDSGIRSSSRLSEQLRENGAMINGHTGRDLITFEITLPSERLRQGVSMIQGLVFNRHFSQEDLNRERLVVQQEWGESRDDPAQRGTRLLLRRMFPDHPYGRSTFGTMEDLERLTLTNVEDYYRTYFTPDRCSISVVGDVNPEEVESALNSGIGSLRFSSRVSEAKEIPAPKKLSGNDEIMEAMDIHQAHLFIGFHAPAYNHEHRIGVRIISQMLGRGIYPLLSSWLTGRFKLVSSATMSYLPLAESGCVWVHMVLEPENIKRAKQEFFNFLKRFRNMNFSLRDYPPNQRRGVFDFLESTINQLRIRSESGRESGLQRALSYARFLLINRRRQLESFENQLKRFSPSKLRSLAGKYLLRVPYAMVVLMPVEKS